MTRPELRKLVNIITSVEQLHSQIDDAVARTQLYDARVALLNLYYSAKQACDATEAAEKVWVTRVR